MEGPQLHVPEEINDWLMGFYLTGHPAQFPTEDLRLTVWTLMVLTMSEVHTGASRHPSFGEVKIGILPSPRLVNEYHLAGGNARLAP